MEENMKFCTHCGQRIPYSAQFCEFCGAAQNGQGFNAGMNNGPQMAPNQTVNGRASQPYNESGRPSIINSGKLFFKDAFRVNKRMGRADYWWSALAVCLAMMAVWVLWLLLVVVGYMAGYGSEAVGDIVAVAASLAMGIGYIILTIASLTAEVRRFHDGGYSGWLWLLNFVPFVGSIITLILAC